VPVLFGELPLPQQRLFSVAPVCILLLPVCLTHDLSALRHTSVLGTVCSLYVWLFVVADALWNGNALADVGPAPPSPTTAPSEDDGAFRFSSMCGVIGTFAANFVTQYNAPRFYHELEGGSPLRFARVTVYGFGVAVLMLGLFAAAGYYRFRGMAESNVLKTYTILPAGGSRGSLGGLGSLGGAATVDCAWLGMAFCVVGCFPLVFNPMRAAVFRLFGWRRVEEEVAWKNCLVTVLVVGVAGCVGFVGPELGVINDVKGWTVSMSVGLLFPGIMLWSALGLADLPLSGFSGAGADLSDSLLATFPRDEARGNANGANLAAPASEAGPLGAQAGPAAQAAQTAGPSRAQPGGEQTYSPRCESSPQGPQSPQNIWGVGANENDRLVLVECEGERDYATVPPVFEQQMGSLRIVAIALMVLSLVLSTVGCWKFVATSVVGDIELRPKPYLYDILVEKDPSPLEKPRQHGDAAVDRHRISDKDIGWVMTHATKFVSVLQRPPFAARWQQYIHSTTARSQSLQHFGAHARLHPGRPVRCGRPLGYAWAARVCNPQELVAPERFVLGAPIAVGRRWRHCDILRDSRALPANRLAAGRGGGFATRAPAP